MKKTIFALTMLALLAGAAPLIPCDITAQTKAAKEKGEIEVTLCIDRFHRLCSLGIDKTELKAEGLVIVKQGEWKNVEGNLYEIDLLVKLNGNKKGKIHVTRNCPKRGVQQETVEIARP